MAISAFYLHKRSVGRVLDRIIVIRRERFSNSADYRFGNLDDDSGDEEPGKQDADLEYLGSNGGIDRRISRQRPLGSLNESTFCGRRVSSSLPNVALPNQWSEDDNQPILFNQASYSLERLNLIPSWVPPLQTAPTDDQREIHSYSYSKMRPASVGRVMTPRSPGANTFESGWESDEDGIELADEEDILYRHDNANSAADFMIHDVYTSDKDPSTVDRHNCVLNHKHDLITNEAKTRALVHDDGKVDAATIQPLGTMLHEPRNLEDEEVCKMLRECLHLRDCYVYRGKVPPWIMVAESGASETNHEQFQFDHVEVTDHYFRMQDGVIHVYANKDDNIDLYPVASSRTFFTDLHHLLKIIAIGNVRTASHQRLRFLEEKFRLHLLVNADREFLAQKSAPHRDFYNVRKVDTHVHHSACMNQKHLLRFIKLKLKKEPDEVVIYRDGKYLTLMEVFQSLDLTGHDLNVDLLDVHADKSTFHRFDKFNLKYNPCGQSRLREIFLKQDNLIQGVHCTELKFLYIYWLGA